MIIYFIRHGATAGNLEKRYIGRTDEELCTEGIERLKDLTGRGADHDSCGTHKPEDQ